MTIKEYISQKLQGFGNISEAELIDMAEEGGFYLDDEYDSDGDRLQICGAMVSFIEERALTPFMKSVSENGFSMSWDMNHIGGYYKLLCERCGRTPKAGVLSILGISTITDKTDIW